MDTALAVLTLFLLSYLSRLTLSHRNGCACLFTKFKRGFTRENFKTINCCDGAKTFFALYSANTNCQLSGVFVYRFKVYLEDLHEEFS